MAPEKPVQALALFKSTATIARAHKKQLHIAVCPSDIHLMALAKTKASLSIGVQHVAPVDAIASTGLVSAAQAKAAGATYALIGHSECRARGEDNGIVAAQVSQALKAKLIPILCVGEQSRDAQGWYLSVIKEQIESAYAGVPKAALKRMVIAYEPVWAIGAAATRQAKPLECREMVIFIRKTLADLYDEKIASLVPILYGGSVDEANAKGFVMQGGAQGLLVGRVSLDAKRFKKLVVALAAK
jgi:triosephosphate isomerase